MAEDDDIGGEEGYEDDTLEAMDKLSDELRAEVAKLIEDYENTEEDEIDYEMQHMLLYLSILWADFHLYINDPYIEPIEPPIVFGPEIVAETGELEHVYPITDHGYLLSTSRAEDGLLTGRSMGKYFNTVEKMIHMMVERLKTGGIDAETEARVAFSGHEYGQRRAYESILNLDENVVVTNYEAGEWIERHMRNIKEIAARGYGYPSSSPRSVF